MIHRYYVNLIGGLSRTLKAILNFAGTALIKPWAVGRKRYPLVFSRDAAPKILYISVAYRGDLLINFPAIAAIKRTYPNATVHCWVNEYNQQLAEANRNVSRTLSYPVTAMGLVKSIREVMFTGRHKNLSNAIRAEQFDVLLDDSGTAFTSLIGWQSLVKLRIGRNSQGFGFMNHRSIPYDFNANLYAKRLKLLEVIGIDSYQEEDFSQEHIQLPDGTNDQIASLVGFDLSKVKYWTIQMFAGWPAKNWLPERFLEVVRKFQDETGLRTVFVGSEEDSHKIAKLNRLLPDGVVIAAGKLSLLETYALIANSVLHFGVDSVGQHMATLSGTKSVTIFGPTNPHQIARLSPTNVAIAAKSRCMPRKGEIYCCYDAGRSCPINDWSERLQATPVLEVLRRVWLCVENKSVCEI